ncbi:allantoinase AllB [Allobranchiibius sp. GilTou38]|uniref:allantoinase AllB n=1 Tax=Allobranchiibius sp. GilTou38 TaxID=2815210 RepID=UPI001AA17FB4|nr:allantoinase AllB [Allobranchiibius sp. GilTou38]MBO1767332.1 allantoinase AllB [Allobranchiibius sp. GilTou38]
MPEAFDQIFVASRAVVAGVERPAVVGVRAGTIAAVGTLDAHADWSGERIRLADDEVLVPGIVDTHVHVNEPGRTDWEGFASATSAALSGGTTTLLDMPLNSLPPTTTLQALRVKQDAARGQCFMDVGFWGGAVPGNLDQLGPLHDAGVFGFKCFLIDSGVPEFAPLSSSELVQYMQRVAELGALMIVHAEDPDVIAAAPQARGRQYSDFVASRPDSSEVSAIRTVIEAVRRTGARAHILHLSSAAALDELRAAKAEGLPLTVETCPHYLTFAAETIRDGSTAHKCCPPIRGESNRDELWEGLSDGTIDMVVSDHSPCTVDLKQLDSGDLGTAWGGVASVEVALRAVWTGARERGIELARVVDWMSTRPAAVVGLTEQGGIDVGRRADLVAFAPEESLTVDARRLHHKNKLTAYDGITLRGAARRTWLGGREASTAHAAGRFLVRSDTPAPTHIATSREHDPKETP